MPLDTLHDLLVVQLRDLFSAETQMGRALPRLTQSASHAGLVSVFKTQFAETERQLDRLEQVFVLLEADPRGRRCKAMEGLLTEGAAAVEEPGEIAVREAAMIAAAQRAGHYEIAAYRSAAAIADLLGHERIVGLLLESLREEIGAARRLAGLAQSEINPRALFDQHDAPGPVPADQWKGWEPPPAVPPAEAEVRQCEVILRRAEEAVRRAGEELRRSIRNAGSAERSLRDAKARAERNAQVNGSDEGAGVNGRPTEAFYGH